MFEKLNGGFEAAHFDTVVGEFWTEWWRSTAAVGGVLCLAVVIKEEMSIGHVAKSVVKC